MSEYLSPECFDNLESHCKGAYGRRDADEYLMSQVDCHVMPDIIKLIRELRECRPG